MDFLCTVTVDSVLSLSRVWRQYIVDSLCTRLHVWVPTGGAESGFPCWSSSNPRWHNVGRLDYRRRFVLIPWKYGLDPRNRICSYVFLLQYDENKRKKTWPVLRFVDFGPQKSNFIFQSPKKADLELVFFFPNRWTSRVVNLDDVHIFQVILLPIQEMAYSREWLKLISFLGELFNSFSSAHVLLRGAFFVVL